MKSLFLKIFISFWLAIALIVIGQTVSFLSSRPDNPAPGFRSAVENSLSIYGEIEAEAFERDGQSGLVKSANRIEQGSNIRTFLMNEKLEDMTGRHVSNEVQEIAHLVQQSGKTEWKDQENNSYNGQVVKLGNGHTYVFVAELQRRRFNFFSAQVRRWRFLFFGEDPKRLVFRVLAMLMTAGVVCYWLARYISSPVVKLRKATQQLSTGDLSTRVGYTMGRRKDELAMLGRDFDVMASRIESLLNSQRRLLSDISHELRSPLARLNVALELARQRAGTDSKSALDRIEREASRLNEMIGQLLSLTRWEIGGNGHQNEQVDLARIIREVTDDADFEARGRNCHVRLDSPEECKLSGTDSLLWSAVENVVRNAVRYTAEGTDVEVMLRCEKHGKQDEAIITVRDHGAGVPEETIEEIFRPFYRVADARDRQSGGVGLGLSITERAVRLHGGTVKAANASGGGLIVEMRLPVQDQAFGVED